LVKVELRLTPCAMSSNVSSVSRMPKVLKGCCVFRVLINLMLALLWRKFAIFFGMIKKNVERWLKRTIQSCECWSINPGLEQSLASRVRLLKNSENPQAAKLMFYRNAVQAQPIVCVLCEGSRQTFLSVS